MKSLKTYVALLSIITAFSFSPVKAQTVTQSLATWLANNAAAASQAQNTANAAIPSATLGQPNGPASLGSGGLIPSGQIPFGTTTGTVASGAKACDITGATDCSGALVTANGAAGSTTLAYFAAQAAAALPKAGGTMTGALIGGNAYWGAAKPGGSYGWLESLRQYSLSIGQTASVSTIGKIGAVFGSRTSDDSTVVPGSSPSGGDQGTIGMESICNNDNTSLNQFCFAMYSEAYRQAGAGTTHVWETDAVNLGSTVDVLPNTLTNVGLTTNNWLGCGGGYTSGVNPCSAGIVLLNNGAPYRKGIVFHSTGLAGATATSGEGIAIAFSRGHRMNWYDQVGNVLGYMIADGTNTGNPTGIKIDNAGAFFGNAGEYPVFRINNTTSGANYPYVTSGAAGSGVIFGAAGSDTNVGTTVQGQGTGGVTLGASSSQPTTVVGQLNQSGVSSTLASAPSSGEFVTNQFYRGQRLNWLNSSGSVIGYFLTDSTNTGNPSGIKIDNSGILFGNSGEYPFARINNDGGNDYPVLDGGSSISLTAVGTDTNIPAKVTGKGTGATTIGSATSPALVPGALQRSTAAGLTAAGTTQATALALTKDINAVTTAASGSGVVLSGLVGQDQQVYNRGANALLVYPPSGAQIEAQAANASYSLASGGHATFECVSATQCYVGP